MMQRSFFIIGSGFAMIGVIAGAFGAHGLKGSISGEMLETFEVAVRYQMYHSLGLLAVAWAISRWHSQPIHMAGWLFVIGILVFSGSLYILSLTGIRWFGAIAPVGGLVLIVGWVCLIWGTMRS
jgi:uncharacterized membrane protein YgdD (TMEM256/DUF423 family)